MAQEATLTTPTGFWITLIIIVACAIALILGGKDNT